MTTKKYEPAQYNTALSIFDVKDSVVEHKIEKGRHEFYKEWFAYICEYDEDNRFFYNVSSELFEET